MVDAPNLVLEYFNNEKVLGNFVFRISKVLPLLPLQLGYHIIKFNDSETKKTFVTLLFQISC